MNSREVTALSLCAMGLFAATAQMSAQVKVELSKKLRAVSVQEESPRNPILDEMREQGVKRVVVLVEFVWHNGPQNMHIARTLYYTKAEDFDCAQITDEGRLDDYRRSGLQKQLAAVALKQMATAQWEEHLDAIEPGEIGIGVFEAIDGTTRPLNTYLHRRYRFIDEPLAYENELDIRTLLSSPNATPEQIDRALLQVADHLDDTCSISILLKSGGHVDACDRDGNTALMAASWSGHKRDVRVLLDAGADVNALDANGETSLIVAVRARQIDVVDMLLDAGANPSIASRNGATALSEAKDNADVATIKLIESAIESRTKQ